MFVLCFSTVVIQMVLCTATSLPTLYEHYTSDGTTAGLSVNQPYFTLNGKNITIYSGAMHYFRIPRQYWRDRLRKLRASGLNTVETYIPWNLHEPHNGVFDFGSGGTDMEEFLDVREYLRIAQEEDLLVILRPGPYICSEWDWGGLPSWLMKEEVKIRTSDPVYMSYVRRYFTILLPLLVDLQFTRGGPVVAFQVENEYGSSLQIDLKYIEELYHVMKNNGIVELLFTSDGASHGTNGTLPGLLFQTVNFGDNPFGNFYQLSQMQPQQPVMAMEFWGGWFDHWSEQHHTVNDSSFRQTYEYILRVSASVNLYMFHGGTNWGFLNGANLANNGVYEPTTTSYDYDAALNEVGDYTDKYNIIKELIKLYNSVPTFTPEQPPLIPRKEYSSIKIEAWLDYNDIISRAPSLVFSRNPIPMEKLSINGGAGQNFGYTIYRKEGLNISAGSVLTIGGYIHDTILILLNGVLVSKPLNNSEDLRGFGYWNLNISSIILTGEELTDVTLDIVVENCGRVNYGNLYNQYKGLSEYNLVSLNGKQLTSWIIYPLEFKKTWNLKLAGWKSLKSRGSSAGPALYSATLTLQEDPADVYINMERWTKGIVIVNGFVLGRYALIGPQQALYLPGPFLKRGNNDIVVFEHFRPDGEIKFSTDQIFKTF